MYMSLLQKKARLRAQALLFFFSFSYSISANLQNNPLFQKQIYDHAMENLYKSKQMTEEEKESSLYYTFADKHVLEPLYQGEFNKYLQSTNENSSENKKIEQKISRNIVFSKLQTLTKNGLIIPIASDADTYSEIGIKELLKKIHEHGHFTMTESSILAQLCSASTRDTLQECQDKQKFFENNEEIAEDLKHSLETAQSGEQALLRFWNPKHIKVRSNYSSYYGTNIPVINDHASALNAYTYITPLIKASIIGASLAPSETINTAATYLHGLGAVASLQPVISMVFNSANSIPARATRVILSCLDGATLGTITRYKQEIVSNPPGDLMEKMKKELAIVNMINLGAYASLGSMDIYKQYSKINNNEDSTQVHQSLIKVADYIRSAHHIYLTINNDADLKTHFPHFCSTYDALWSDKTTQSIMQDLLDTSTFTGKPSALSNIGRVAIVTKRLLDHKDKFIPLMNEMAEVDKPLAIVAYKKNNPGVFIYATPSRPDKKGYISAKKCVHPAFPQHTPTDIDFGNTKTNTVIINGPNGKGKSSLVKSAAANIVATLLGITAAESFDCSPFGRVKYTANSHDTLGKESRFQAEVRVQKEVYRQKKEDAQNDIIGAYFDDEPYGGTSEAAGSSAFNISIKRTAEIPNSKGLNIAISHYQGTGGDIQYYHVKNNEKDQYKLFPGRSTEINAAELVSASFNEVDQEL